MVWVARRQASSSRNDTTFKSTAVPRRPAKTAASCSFAAGTSRLSVPPRSQDQASHRGKDEGRQDRRYGKVAVTPPVPIPAGRHSLNIVPKNWQSKSPLIRYKVYRLL